MKKNVALALSGLLLLSACRSKGDEPPLPPSPGKLQEALSLHLTPGITSLSLAATPTSGATLGFLDLNANGTKDAGEEVAETKKVFTLPTSASTVKLYGEYTSLDLTDTKVEQLEGPNLASLTELKLSGTSLSLNNLSKLAEALGSATKERPRTLYIGEEQLSSPIIQSLEAKGWTLLRANGTTIDPKEPTIIIRLQPLNGVKEGGSLAFECEGAQDLWLDKNLNGTKDAGEELKDGTGILEHPKDGNLAVYIIHGTAPMLDVYAATSNSGGDEDEEEEEESQTSSLMNTTPSASLVSMEVSIDLSRSPSMGVISWSPRSGLVAIEATGATQLVNLSVAGNPIRELALPKTSVLRTLGLTANELTELDLSTQEKLQTCTASSGKIAKVSLPKKALDLTVLNLSGNSLTEIDLTALPNLKNVNLSKNKLTKVTLGASKYGSMEFFNVSENKLTKLDLQPLIKTKRINVGHNPLTEVTWPGDLKELIVSATELTVLDLTPVQGQTAFIQILDASDNAKLREIKVVESRLLKTIKLTATPALDLTKLPLSLPEHPTASPGHLTIELSRLSAELQSQLKARGWTPTER